MWKLNFYSTKFAVCNTSVLMYRIERIIFPISCNSISTLLLHFFHSVCIFSLEPLAYEHIRSNGISVQIWHSIPLKFSHAFTMRATFMNIQSTMCPAFVKFVHRTYTLRSVFFQFFFLISHVPNLKVDGRHVCVKLSIRVYFFSLACASVWNRHSEQRIEYINKFGLFSSEEKIDFL